MTHMLMSSPHLPVLSLDSAVNSTEFVPNRASHCVEAPLRGTAYPIPVCLSLVSYKNPLPSHNITATHTSLYISFISLLLTDFSLPPGSSRR